MDTSWRPADIEHEETPRGLCVYPSTEQELTRLLREAAASKTRLVVDLGQTVLPWRAVLVSYVEMKAIREHHVSDYLVSVQPGITVGDLQRELNQEQQGLGRIYSPHRELISILAEETVSPSFYLAGPLRYQVTGLRVITGDGALFHYGGEVVKNVAGYDMIRLFIGGQHQYGLLTEVTLKTKPLPEMSRPMMLYFSHFKDAWHFVQAARDVQFDTDILAMLKPHERQGWQVVFRILGPEALVEANLSWFGRYMNTHQPRAVILPLAPEGLLHWIEHTDWTDITESQKEGLVLRIILPELDLPLFLQAFETERYLKYADLNLCVGSGALTFRFHHRHSPSFKQALQLQERVRDMGGQLLCLVAPATLESEYFALNQPQQTVLQTWSARLKQQFDPHGILPNRIGGSR
jgi:FAD/FMN-containing dehydrogenase